MVEANLTVGPGAAYPVKNSFETLRAEYYRIRDVDEFSPGGESDPGVVAFASAMVEMLGKEDFSYDLASTLKMRTQPLPPGALATLSFHAAHKGFLQAAVEAIEGEEISQIEDRDERRNKVLDALKDLGGPDYFDQVTNKDFWLERLSKIHEDKQLNEQFFSVDLMIRTNQTNIPERYVSSFWGGLLMQRILRAVGREPQVRKLDIGCSANLGLAQESLGIPFGDIEVGHLEHDEAADEYHFTLDERDTKKVARALQAKEHLIDSYGLDLIDVDEDVNTLLWIVSNSFKPGDLRVVESQRKQRFIELWQRKAESGVGFVAAHFDNDSEMAATPIADKKFNMISFYTMLYQLSPPKRKEMLKRAQDMLEHPTGVVLVQDFAAVDPNNPHELQFREKWGNWRYGTFMYDREKGWQELFRWFNRRCGRVALGPGIIDLGTESIQLSTSDALDF